jgi:hypothetical protein
MRWMGLILLLAICSFASLAFASGKAKVNGKEVSIETGTIIRYSPAGGEIVFKLDGGATGNWTMGKQMGVYRNKEKITLADTQSGQKFRIYVTPGGEVQRLVVLDESGQGKQAKQARTDAATSKDDAAEAQPKKNVMNGKEVSPEIGSVNMVNEQKRKIVINLEGGAKGNWSLHPKLVVRAFNTKEVLPLSEVLKSSKVKAWVSKDGVVHWIYIMAYRK